MPAVDLGLYDCLQEVNESSRGGSSSSEAGDYDFANV